MMHNDRCCGYTERLKLHVYGLVNHPIAVHLDLDSLLLRPMDDLFDAMLALAPKTPENPLPLARGPKTKTPHYTIPIDVAFTRDYNQLNDPKPEAQVGYQGGFLAVKPSLEVMERYKQILQKGEFVLTPNWQERQRILLSVRNLGIAVRDLSPIGRTTNKRVIRHSTVVFSYW
eukprot:scaffold152695_cov38-Cyclotella_meneghiniana.AAC.3